MSLLWGWFSTQSTPLQTRWENKSNLCWVCQWIFTSVCSSEWRTLHSSAMLVLQDTLTCTSAQIVRRSTSRRWVSRLTKCQGVKRDYRRRENYSSKRTLRTRQQLEIQMTFKRRRRKRRNLHRAWRSKMRSLRFLRSVVCAMLDWKSVDLSGRRESMTLSLFRDFTTRFRKVILTLWQRIGLWVCLEEFLMKIE